jgi:hypothetical protein
MRTNISKERSLKNLAETLLESRVGLTFWPKLPTTVDNIVGFYDEMNSILYGGTRETSTAPSHDTITKTTVGTRR